MKNQKQSFTAERQITKLEPEIIFTERVQKLKEFTTGVFDKIINAIEKIELEGKDSEDALRVCVQFIDYWFQREEDLYQIFLKESSLKQQKFMQCLKIYTTFSKSQQLRERIVRRNGAFMCCKQYFQNRIQEAHKNYQVNQASLKAQQLRKNKNLTQQVQLKKQSSIWSSLQFKFFSQERDNLYQKIEQDQFLKDD